MPDFQARSIEAEWHKLPPLPREPMRERREPKTTRRFEHTMKVSGSLATYSRMTHWVKWFEGATVSPDLTEAELYDIHVAIQEIESGQATRFRNLGEALEWLNRKRTS